MPAHHSILSFRSSNPKSYANPQRQKDASLQPPPPFRLCQKIQPPSALVSRGSLPGALNPQIQSSNPGQIDFTWQDNFQDSTANTFDKVILVVLNPAKQKAITVIGGNERSACAQSIEVPSTFAGDQVECFIAFQNLNQFILSNSVYAGPVNVFID